MKINNFKQRKRIPKVKILRIKPWSSDWQWKFTYYHISFAYIEPQCPFRLLYTKYYTTLKGS